MSDTKPSNTHRSRNSSNTSESGDSERKTTIVGSNEISTLRRAIGESESRILLRQTDNRKVSTSQKSRATTPSAEHAAGGDTGQSAGGQVSAANKDNNEDANSVTTTTSDVDSDDDAASIVSRLSQIIVEQEGKLHFVSDLLEDSGAGSDFSGGTVARSPVPKDGQQQQQLARHRSPLSQAGGPKGTRHMTASTRRRQNLATPTSQQQPKINVVDIDEDAPITIKVPQKILQNDSDSLSSLETTGRSRARSVVEAKSESPVFRRNESSGHLPERGDLRTLEQSRKLQQSCGRANKLMRSKSIRAASEDKLTDSSGQLMLNIRRSAWTLNEFDQTFNKSGDLKQQHQQDGSAQLGVDATQSASDMSSNDYSNSMYQPNLVAATTATASPVGSPVHNRKVSTGSCLSNMNDIKPQQIMSSPNLLIRASKNAQQQSTAMGMSNGPPYGNLLGDHLAVNKSPNGELEHERRHSAVSFASSLDSFWSTRHGISGARDNGKDRKGAADDPYHNDTNRTGRFSSCLKSFFNMQTLGQYLPIVEWLPRYKISFLWGDLVAGIVVAVLNISTSLSAAVVAETEMSPAFKASIVNTFVYALLCSSRHVSFGSWSIMSQMLLVSVRRALSDELLLKRLNIGPSHSWDAAEYEHWHLNIIIMYTFLIGLVQLLGGLLKLGNILASFIPEALCSGMIAATAFTMAVAQLANMCGTSNKILFSIERNTTALWADLKNPPVDITDLFAGLFRWIQQVALLIKYYEQINMVCVLISVISVMALFLNQYVIQKQLERQFKRSILIPFEMILLIVMIIVSYSLDLSTNFSIATCSPVYIDFSVPTWPNLKLIREIWFDSLATALISYTMVCVMAKTYSNKLNYEVDCNQELIACGAGNLIGGGLFDALPATASLSRTAGQVEAGGQTQMASIINCVVLYAVAQLLGHHVAVLPVCVMSATLFYGFVRMLARFSDVFALWRVCKVDFAIWIVTFTAILVSDLVSGFVYGFIFSILTLLYRAQK